MHIQAAWTGSCLLQRELLQLQVRPVMHSWLRRSLSHTSAGCLRGSFSSTAPPCAILLDRVKDKITQHSAPAFI